MKEKELLALLVGTGMLTLAEGKEVNLDNVKEAVNFIGSFEKFFRNSGRGIE